MIPNVYNFDAPYITERSYCDVIRKKAGLAEGDLFILQPTRIVPRKWIEKAVDVVSMMRLENPTLVISHPSGDEGGIYLERVTHYARNNGVRLAFLEHMVSSKEGINRDNSNNILYTIDDIYRCADLVTYPSGYEGFGNAFLETVYHKKPIVTNRYSIFIADIEPKGFETISFDGFVTHNVVDRIFEVLNNSSLREEMVEKNFALARQYFSYDTLKFYLEFLLRDLEKEYLL
jgi:glycosyltransferase involved in cell wall biosynthesis